MRTQGLQYGKSVEMEVVYSWGTKNGSHESHFFKHDKTNRAVPGTFWESLCGKHKTAQLGFESGYRRVRPQDAKCRICERKMQKTRVVV